MRTRVPQRRLIRRRRRRRRELGSGRQVAVMGSGARLSPAGLALRDVMAILALQQGTWDRKENSILSSIRTFSTATLFAPLFLATSDMGYVP